MLVPDELAEVEGALEQIVRASEQPVHLLDVEIEGLEKNHARSPLEADVHSFGGGAPQDDALGNHVVPIRTHEGWVALALAPEGTLVFLPQERWSNIGFTFFEGDLQRLEPSYGRLEATYASIEGLFDLAGQTHILVRHGTDYETAEVLSFVIAPAPS